MELLLNDKQVVGIWRIRGIGKATIAQEVFHQNRNKFDGYYFVENVRETMTKESSNDVRDKIIRQLLRNKSLQEGKCDLYGDGSRIIVTRRDRQVIKYVGSKEGIYEVESLIDSQENEKKIFLDIACFFKGENKDRVERTLAAFGFYPKSGIPHLIKKSLISISSVNQIRMHDLLEQMGKDIVIEECEQPGGGSRLWSYEDINHGTEKVEGILLGRLWSYYLELRYMAFIKMCNLRFLKLEVWNKSLSEQVLLLNDFEFLPQKLRYLSWQGCNKFFLYYQGEYVDDDEDDDDALYFWY
ncbi:disease resistance protein RRS1B-like [Hevea brasiliensis]|uniref:disease resistance protein RRS1B-like n=1 Tax=Hevea brasiliensis TaxID=3981 RepID=UPI0025E0DD61|nr:disease resistance protein RRS1B-like [Hevea brasiliensis]